MLTGTDEHGQKMLRAAAANGVTPQEWVDKLVTESWFPLLKTLDVANDDFIRTTQPRHEERVQQFVKALYDRGYIYAGEYEALYCVGCEEFKPEAEIVDGTGAFEGLKVCAIHSKPLELLQEKNYFFKLSEFQDRLLELYKTEPDFVRPESARNEVVSFVRSGLKDLSISRSAFDWGITVPWDPSHVIYVWVDALLNYATAVGYGTDPAVRATVAGLPRRRQGHPPLPRGDLARDADGCRSRRAPRCVRARLAVGRRREDVEVEAHRHRPDRDHRRVRFGRLPLLLPVGDRVRPGRLVLVGGPLGALPGRARERIRQPRVADDAMIEKYFEGIVPPPAAYTEGDLGIQRIVADAASAPMRRWSVPSRRGDRGDLDHRRRAQRLHHRERPVGAGEGRRAQRPSCDGALHGGGGSACARGAAEPRDADRHREAVGRARARGRLQDQPLREAGSWGVLVPGTSVNGLEPLFPRIEQP
jgi:methionyl-tRNA synthetase